MFVVFGTLILVGMIILLVVLFLTRPTDKENTRSVDRNEDTASRPSLLPTTAPTFHDDDDDASIINHSPTTATPTRSPQTWIQLGVDIDGQARFDKFGVAVALSVDGCTVAVGAKFNEAGGALDAGHVRVFTYQQKENYGDSW